MGLEIGRGGIGVGSVRALTGDIRASQALFYFTKFICALLKMFYKCIYAQLGASWMLETLEEAGTSTLPETHFAQTNIKKIISKNQ